MMMMALWTIPLTQAVSPRETLTRLTQQTQSVSQTITQGQSFATQTAVPSMATSQNGRNGHLRTTNVQVSAQAPTRSPNKPAPDGAMILRTEATLVRPHNQEQKRETVPQVRPVLWTVSVMAPPGDRGHHVLEPVEQEQKRGGGTA